MLKLTKNCFHAFKNPFELLVFYDNDIREGRTDLYGWQYKFLKDFGELSPDAKRQALVASNGSGKSKYILAPCILWLPTMFDFGFSYVTSASADQLDTQTERYVDFLIDKMNTVHKEQFGGEVWRRVKRKKNYSPTNGFIDLIATDEGGKAEGKHPLANNSAFGVFKDESKSITEEIHEALDRCNGYSHWTEVSSPGGCRGQFYNVITRAQELEFKVTKVTSFDCPHVTRKSIDLDILKHGINSPFIRSMHFAEFSSYEDKTLITRENYLSCQRKWKGYSPEQRTRNTWAFGEHSGLDLSAGGDEFVLSIWRGNVQVAQETGRFSNTSLETDEIIHWIQKYNLQANKIWADDGGIGRGIIDNLHRAGYKVNRRLNNWRALDAVRFANRGTEDWFNFKRFVEEAQVCLLLDNILQEQFCNRFYKQSDGSGKIQLESKQQARANGHPSPDRADACVLAWCEYRFPLNLDELLGIVPQEELLVKTSEDQLLRDFAVARHYMIARDFNGGEALGLDGGSANKTTIQSSLNNNMFLPSRLKTRNNGQAYNSSAATQQDILDSMGVEPINPRFGKLRRN